AAGERDRRRPAWPQIDARALTEPGAQSVGGGERRPHVTRWTGQGHGALDAIRERHRCLLGATPSRRRPSGRRAVGRGSSLLLGGAAGEVPRAAVGGARATLGELAQTGPDEVVPAAAAHVLALELVVQPDVLEGQLAGVLIDGRDREGWVRPFPVLHE